MNYIQFGPVTLPSGWISVLIGVFAVSLIFQWFYKKELNWLINAFLLFILIWKLSYFIIDWEIAWKNPLSVLYFHGGKAGLAAGALGASVYIWLNDKRERINLYEFAQSYALFMFFYEISSLILSGRPDAVPIIQSAVILIGWRLMKTSSRKSGKQDLLQLVVLFGLVNLLFYSLRGLFFAVPSYTHIWIVAVFLILFKREERI
ncbi:hypothetical protein ACQCVE_16300 [Metabacillus sp. 113a]|uniref:hypothetical protein n=1 Tax=Metabacillus sp. 113a TaxID=3404706 RepID=UPI003CF751C0